LRGRRTRERYSVRFPMAEDDARIFDPISYQYSFGLCSPELIVTDFYYRKKKTANRVYEKDSLTIITIRNIKFKKPESRAVQNWRDWEELIFELLSDERESSEIVRSRIDRKFIFLSITN